MIRSDQINELVSALAKAQGKILGALKDAENPHFKSDYATLDSAWEACRLAVSSNEIAVIQSPSTTVAGTVKITTLLAHSSGQWIEDSIELIPHNQTPQAVGSAITYGRRYALMGMVGIAPKDDDGNTASGITPDKSNRPAPPTITSEPKKKDAAPLTEPGLYKCQFGQKFNGVAIRDIAAADLRGYVKYLKDSAAMEKKKLGGMVSEFVINADAYLNAQGSIDFQDAPSSLWSVG